MKADIANTRFGPGSEFGFRNYLADLRLTEVNTANRSQPGSEEVRFRIYYALASRKDFTLLQLTDRKELSTSSS